MLSYPDFKLKTIVIVFTTEGHHFSFKNDNLIVTNDNNEIILQTTCYRILSLWIVGHAVITSGLLERSKKFAFPVYLLSVNFRCIGLWSSPVEGNFLLRNIQYHFKDLNIARHIVKNKLYNQVETLKSIRSKDEDCKTAIDNIENYKIQIDKIKDLQSLLGIEGIASRIYFQNWYKNMEWQGRKPRAKRDKINVLLDIGYTFLFYMIENMLNLYGFDIYMGVYHQCFYQRKSLVCDIVEPFRCIIDKQIKKAYNLGQIKDDDFDIIKGQYILKHDKSKEYTRWLMSAIIEYKADIFIYCQNYYRSFIRQRSISEYPFFKIDEKTDKN